MLKRSVAAFRIRSTHLKASILLGVAGSVGLIHLATAPAHARDKRDTRKEAAVSSVATIAPTPPLITLISLNRQRMYVYDANGMVAQSRVSTGTSGYDTPKGIYSIIGKKEMHESNLYEGAPMPHMQRLLWSGIALHGGHVPRSPASHGCIRLPYGFDKTFFGMTRLNDRVIITPEVQAPAAVDHPILFSALPPTEEHHRRAQGRTSDLTQVAVNVNNDESLSLSRTSRTLDSVVADRNSEELRLIAAAEFAKTELAIAHGRVGPLEQRVKDTAQEVKPAQALAKTEERRASRAEREAKSAAKRLDELNSRIAKLATKTRADKFFAMTQEQIKLSEKSREAATGFETAAGRHKAAKAALDAAVRSHIQAKADLEAARSEAADRTAKEASARQALEEYQLAQRNFSKPLSIFISAKTGMISLRQGMEPIAEAPVTISNRRQPVGTFVFTATGWSDASETKLKWIVTGVDEKGEIENKRGRDSETDLAPPQTSAIKAQAALDRILVVPIEISEKIAERMKPGSTLIISDYDMARSETGKGTDFIVQMPEVIAKYRTPEEIAAGRQRRLMGNDPFLLTGGVPPPPGFTVRGGRLTVSNVSPPSVKTAPKWSRPTHLPRFFNFQQN